MLTTQDLIPLVNGSLGLIEKVLEGIGGSTVDGIVTRFREYCRGSQYQVIEALRSAWKQLWRDVGAGFRPAGLWEWVFLNRDGRQFRQHVRQMTSGSEQPLLRAEFSLADQQGIFRLDTTAISGAQAWQPPGEAVQALYAVEQAFQTIIRQMNDQQLFRLADFVQCQCRDLTNYLLLLINQQVRWDRNLQKTVSLGLIERQVGAVAQLVPQVDLIIQHLFPEPTAGNGSAAVGLPPAFDDKARLAEEYCRLWVEVAEQVGQLLDEQSRVPDDPRNARARENRQRLTAWQEQMKAAIKDLQASLVHPRVVLATVGTTSSGKTTVVNLLVGNGVAPVDPQEISAGVLTINHQPGTIRLEVRSTEGACWPTGTREFNTAYEVSEYLESVMRQYNAVRDRSDAPAAPIFYLDCTTILGLYPHILQIPTGCQLAIKDLPGSKHAGDRGNLAIIREHAREALCLLVYDTTETDPTRRAKLLEEVVEAIKTAGGSAARFLLLGNKADVWLKQEKHGELRLREHLDQLRREITETLKERMPEQMRAIGQMQMVEISAEPAMLALQVLHSATPEQRLQALRNLVGSYGILIPDQLRQNLPFDPSRWPAERAGLIAKAVFQAANGHRFFNVLREHLRQNLPDLIIPISLETFRQSPGGWEALTSFSRMVEAERNGPQERYEAEIARLGRVSDELRIVRQRGEERLQRPLDEMEEAVSGSLETEEAINSALQRWESIARNLERTFNMPEYTLAPLWTWRKEINYKINGVLSAIRRDLVGEGRFASLTPVPLPNRFIRRVEEALRKVREAGYTPQHARMGGRHEHANMQDQARADQLVRALNNLTEQLKDVLNEVVFQSSSLEAQRINDALQALFRNHKKAVAEEAQQVVQNQGLHLTLVIPDSTFSPAELRTRLNFRAKDLSETLRRSEQVQEGYLKVQVGTKKVKQIVPSARRSFWQKLVSWLITPTEEVEVPVFEDRPNIVTRTFTQILTAAELENEWATMVRQQQPELVRQCMNWLKEETLEVAESIREFQEKLMNEYRKELDKVHETARIMTEKEEKAWESAQAAIKRLESKFQELVSWQ